MSSVLLGVCGAIVLACFVALRLTARELRRINAKSAELHARTLGLQTLIGGLLARSTALDARMDHLEQQRIEIVKTLELSPELDRQIAALNQRIIDELFAEPEFDDEDAPVTRH